VESTKYLPARPRVERVFLAGAYSLPTSPTPLRRSVRKPAPGVTKQSPPTAIATVLGASPPTCSAVPSSFHVLDNQHVLAHRAPACSSPWASDGLVFRNSPKSSSLPHSAFAVVSRTMVCVPFLHGNISGIVNYTMFVAWIFYGLGAASSFLPQQVSRLPCLTVFRDILDAAAVRHCRPPRLVIRDCVNAKNAAIGLGIVPLAFPRMPPGKFRETKPRRTTN